MHAHYTTNTPNNAPNTPNNIPNTRKYRNTPNAPSLLTTPTVPLTLLPHRTRREISPLRKGPARLHARYSPFHPYSTPLFSGARQDFPGVFEGTL